MDTTPDELPIPELPAVPAATAAPVTLPPAPAVPAGEPRKLFTPCQDHPSEPAGRCRHCEALAVEPTSEFAAARAQLRSRRRAS